MQGRAQSPSVRCAGPRRVAQTEQNRDCWIAIEQNGLSAMTTGPAVQSFALVWQQTWDVSAEPLSKHPYCVYSQCDNVDAQRQCVVARRRRVVRQLMQDKTAPAAATTASRCADEVRIAQVSLEPISWTRMHNAQSYVGTMGSGWGEGTATPSCSSASVFSQASGRDLLCAYRSPYRAPSDRRSAARNYYIPPAQLGDLPTNVSRSGAVPARA